MTGADVTQNILNDLKMRLLAYFCVTAIYGLNSAAFPKHAFVNNTSKVFLGVFGRRFTENMQPGPQNI